MIWSGGMAWIADFPDPSDFYGPILGCGGAVAGRLELVVVLQPRTSTRRPPQADAIADPAKAERAAGPVARHLPCRSWTTRPGRRSSTRSTTPCALPRVGGADALFVDPIYTPINYDYVWVNDGK